MKRALVVILLVLSLLLVGCKPQYQPQEPDPVVSEYQYVKDNHERLCNELPVPAVNIVGEGCDWLITVSGDTRVEKFKVAHEIKRSDGGRDYVYAGEQRDLGWCMIRRYGPLKIAPIIELSTGSYSYACKSKELTLDITPYI